jgi:hypothetical protein
MRYTPAPSTSSSDGSKELCLSLCIEEEVLTMALRITIRDATVHRREVKTEKGGFTQIWQDGILTAGVFTYPAQLRLVDGETPKQAGEYLVEDESFGVDEYDNVTIRRGGLKLRPVGAVKAA